MVPINLKLEDDISPDPTQSNSLSPSIPPPSLPPIEATPLQPPPPTTPHYEIPPEFADDLNLRLGRANGNVYHRQPGVPNTHDGQIMVRLKKKRFIVIDYGITDLPHPPPATPSPLTPLPFNVPSGAGRDKCATPHCPKVGVPVLLYDSSPEEPASLYIRSGLCFTCQRALNEKRRTQRKRKGDANNTNANNNNNDRRSQQQRPALDDNTDATKLTKTASDRDDELNNAVKAADKLIPRNVKSKRYKLNDDVITLPPDAIIITNPGITITDDDNTQLIPRNVKSLLDDASQTLDRLRHLASPPTATDHDASSPPPPSTTTDDMVAIAAAAAAAAAVTNGTDCDDELNNAVKAAADATEGMAIRTAEERLAAMMTCYEEAMEVMTKGVYMLSRWKAVVEERRRIMEVMTGGVTNGEDVEKRMEKKRMEEGMIPLLLAAEGKNEGEEGMKELSHEEMMNAVEGKNESTEQRVVGGSDDMNMNIVEI